jgi:hypothetical protein
MRAQTFKLPKLSIIFVLLSIFTVVAHYSDFREPLNKEKVILAIRREITQKTIRRISLLQGGRAGDIGYYFVEFEPEGYRVVINDSRFSLYDESIVRFKKRMDMESPLTLIGHIYQYRTAPLRYKSTLGLKVRSLFNMIFSIRTREQRFWDSL